MNSIRLGTRKSALAQTQARWVAERLQSAFPNLRIQTVLIATSGDLAPKNSTPVPRFRGDDINTGLRRDDVNSTPPVNNLKAQFTKELEEALLANTIDLAVHSLKDMAAEMPKGLAIGAVPEREDPRDAWISNKNLPLNKLLAGARIGTGAVRRQAQLRNLRPDLEIVPVRGNVDTRLKRLLDPGFRRGDGVDVVPAQAGTRFGLDGIVLAVAGLRRLGKESSITEILPLEMLLPAIGQGCLGIQVRDQDREMAPFLHALDHPPSHAASIAERAFLSALGGSCQTPIAAYASLSAGVLTLSALVITPDGQEVLRASDSGRAFDATGVGKRLARQLLAAGAGKILNTRGQG